jgi:hypothetical protein
MPGCAPWCLSEISEPRRGNSKSSLSGGGLPRNNGQVWLADSLEDAWRLEVLLEPDRRERLRVLGAERHLHHRQRPPEDRLGIGGATERAPDLPQPVEIEGDVPVPVRIELLEDPQRVRVGGLGLVRPLLRLAQPGQIVMADRSEIVVGAQRPLPDRQRPLQRLFRVRRPTQCEQKPADAYQAAGRVGMLRAEHLLPYVQGAAEERLGVGWAPLRQNGPSETCEAFRDLGVLGAEGTLPDAECPLREPLGRRCVSKTSGCSAPRTCSRTAKACRSSSSACG